MEVGKLFQFLRNRSKRHPGQMTVEFVVMFPVAIALSLIAVNATLFFSDCAAFDRVFRSSVCTWAVSPAYGQDTSASCAKITSLLDAQFNAEYLDIEVNSTGSQNELVTFTGTLHFHPTLFGKGALRGAFGITFPDLVHTSSLSVDVYKPGVLL